MTADRWPCVVHWNLLTRARLAALSVETCHKFCPTETQRWQWDGLLVSLSCLSHVQGEKCNISPTKRISSCQELILLLAKAYQPGVLADMLSQLEMGASNENDLLDYRTQYPIDHLKENRAAPPLVWKVIVRAPQCVKSWQSETSSVSSKASVKA